MNIKAELPSPHQTSNPADGRRPSTMPQRSPFAIQELLGLNETTNIERKMGPGLSSLPQFQNKVLPHFQNDSNFHHHMLAAGNLTSRMAYFNAQAAVAAAYNMNSMAAAAAAAGMAGNGANSAGNPSAMLRLNHITGEHNAGGKSTEIHLPTVKINKNPLAF